jgi:hypothetical protein
MIGDDDWGLMEVGKDKVRLPFELVGLSLSLSLYIYYFNLFYIKMWNLQTVWGKEEAWSYVYFLT